jgi:subtilase-type serine protease
MLNTLFFPAALSANPAAEAFRTDEYRAMWGLESIHAADAYALGYTGKGVGVGVVDDGNVLNHPEFAGRTAPWAAAGPGYAMQELRYEGEHSTAVTGVLAAARDGRGMHGVAYEASLIPLAGFWDEPTSMHTDWAIRQAVDMGAKVINASYAPPVYPSYATEDGVNEHYLPQSLQMLHFDRDTGSLQFFSAEAQALRHAARQDVVVVYAAGNEYGLHEDAAKHPGGIGLLPFIRPEHHASGVYRIVDGQLGLEEIVSGLYDPEAYAVMDPNDPRLQALDYSDLQANLIAVVALDRNNEIANYSNRCGVAWMWCIAAPGGAYAMDREDAYAGYVYTSVPGGSYSAEHAGTSYAAPMVAGSLAVLRQAFPYMTGPQVAQVLLTSADRSGPRANKEIYGRGAVDVGRAVRGPVEFGAVGYERIFDVDTKGYDSWWRNDIGGVGGLTKRGQGTLLLTGNNRYSGPTTVKGGTLAVQGSIEKSTLLVERGGTLSGTGTVGTTEIAGTVAPGDPSDALRVAGDYVQRAEGVYRLQISADGQRSDRIDVQGQARLENGRLQVGTIGLNMVNREYTVLRADGGVHGRFAPVPDPYLFLDLEHGVQPDDYTRYRFSVRRNATPFAAAAMTSNQRAVAAALDSTTVGLAPYDAIVMAQHGQELAPRFDRWSGEAHASTLTALTAQSAQVRDAALVRARHMQGHDALPTASPQAVVQDSPDKALWAQYTGSRDRLAADGNAAALQASSSGMLLGTDFAVRPDTRIGVMGGFGNGRIDVDARGSKSKVDSYVLGAYGSSSLQSLRARYGAAYSWHALSAGRDTAGLGMADSRYKAGTAQVFAEAGLPQRLGAATVEPYVGLAYVDTRRRAFDESGKAGLHVDAGRQQLGFSTLGLRGDRNWELKDGTQLALHAGAGWRRAYGGIAPTARMRFAQGDGFEVTGTALARDALLLGLGVALQSDRGMRMGVAYDGQLAAGARSHAIRANVNWAF